MINNHTIVVATQATNLVKNKYHLISQACLKSVARNEYVDEILLITGKNEDETEEIHNVIPKVSFLRHNDWNGGMDLGWWEQHNKIFQICSERAEKGEKLILITPVIEDFWTIEFSKELKNAIQILIKEKKDGFPFPFTKIYTKDIAETIKARYLYEHQGSMLHLGIHRYDKSDKSIWRGYEYKKPLNGMIQGIKGDREFNLLNAFNIFSTTALQYDNWFFTKDIMEQKIKSHIEWNCYGFKDIYIAMEKKLTRKMNSYKVRKIDYDFHPPEIKKLISDNLKNHHQGYDLYGFLSLKRLRIDE